MKAKIQIGKTLRIRDRSMDLQVVGSVVFSVVAVVDSFAAEEQTKINLLMSKMAQRLWKHFEKALAFVCTLLVGVGR